MTEKYRQGHGPCENCGTMITGILLHDQNVKTDENGSEWSIVKGQYCPICGIELVTLHAPLTQPDPNCEVCREKFSILG